MPSLKRFFITAVSMLVIFWISSYLLLLGFGSSTPSSQDVMLAIAVILFFGTIVVIPTMIYLLIADSVARNFSFPMSALIYILTVVVGWIAYVWIMHVAKGTPLPLTSDEFANQFLGTMPLVCVSVIPLLFQILFPSPKKEAAGKINQTEF